jgi:hypothetical protein
MNTRRSVHGATLTNERSNADESGCCLVIDPAEFGDGRKEGQGRLHANPLDGFEQALVALQVGTLTNQRQHHPMHLFVFGPEHL